MDISECTWPLANFQVELPRDSKRSLIHFRQTTTNWTKSTSSMKFNISLLMKMMSLFDHNVTGLFTNIPIDEIILILEY